MDEKIEKLIQYIENSRNIVFFGGAGVSTESGIPDFRSADGLYNQHDVNFEEYTPEYLLSHECLYHNPKVFFEFYRQKMDTRNCGPNITHEVLAKMEKQGKISAIITQNIDGLHQQAGSNKVYEIHGTTKENYCTKCGKEYDENFIFRAEGIPHCVDCDGIVRPRVVLYGERLPTYETNASYMAIREADMLIIGGTSLTVQPAAGMINYFSGRHLIVINKEDVNIAINQETDIVFNNSLGDVFRAIYIALDKQK